jgi:hypothetical protein
VKIMIRHAMTCRYIKRMKEVPRARGGEGEKKVKGEKKRSKDGILTRESTAQDDTLGVR